MSPGRHAAAMPAGRRARAARLASELLDVVLPPTLLGQVAFALGATAIAVLIALLAVDDTAAADRLEKRGATTTAVVVEPGEYKSPWLVVRFTTPDGTEYLETTRFQRSGHDRGDTITVEYLPDDPATVAEAGARTTATTVGALARLVLAGAVGAIPTAWTMRALGRRTRTRRR